jgi:hypothetical protein
MYQYQAGKFTRVKEFEPPILPETVEAAVQIHFFNSTGLAVEYRLENDEGRYVFYHFATSTWGMLMPANREKDAVMHLAYMPEWFVFHHINSLLVTCVDGCIPFSVHAGRLV